MLVTVSYMISPGWHWIDIRCKHDNTTGIAEVWIDDVQVINSTGLNTTRSTTNPLTYVTAGDAFGGDASNMIVDDFFIYTGSRLGDSRIETLVPTSDASPNDGTQSTGATHWGVVDEPQWNTTDYITMPNTSGDKEIFGHGSIVSTPTVIHAVKVYLVSEKTDAGAYSLQPLVKSGGTEGDGASQSLTTTWGVQSAVFNTDPSTSAAWTLSAANASTFGYKVP
jgi:hypothetical protein